jgi:hypothetical protein
VASKYKYISLDPCVVITYCMSYLTKLNKFVTWEMQFTLDKCKGEEIETSKQIKTLGMYF